MIVAKEIVKIYGQNSHPVRAVNNLSFKLPAGVFATIVGPSGSGKSTLLHLLGGIDTLSGGELEVYGQLIHKMSEKELAQYRLSWVGFIFQAFHLIPNLTVFNNVALPAMLLQKSRQHVQERVMQLLEAVGIAAHAQKLPHQLSGGQKQRVAIARALVNDPPVILADEPTGNLDSDTSGQIMKLLNNLHQQGKTVVLVTHDPQIAAMGEIQLRLCDGQLAG